MKMLFLLIISTLGIQIQEQAMLTSGAEARAAVHEFLQSDSLGKMMFSFAQLEMHASGAVDILIEVLKAFGRQQEERLADENAIWQARMGDHNARRISYESLVNEIELQINRDRKKLDQEYVPRSAELDDILLNLKSKMEKNGISQKNAVSLRDDQNHQFQMQANEISEAIKATDETLEYIKRCSQSGSFIQEKQTLSDRLQFLKKKADGATEYMGSMLTALTEMSEKQNFADREVQKELTDLLGSLRSYFVETLQKAYSNEDQQKLLHKERVEQLGSEYSVFEKQYGDAFQEREQKSLQIEDTNKVLENKASEHAGYLARLTTENNNYSQIQKIHDDLVAAINSEIGFIEKALNVLQTEAFTDELQNAINMAK